MTAKVLMTINSFTSLYGCDGLGSLYGCDGGLNKLDWYTGFFTKLAVWMPIQ